MAQTAQRTAKRVLLGREIAFVRVRRDMSQAELGRAINRTQNKITLFEDGRATITEDQLDAVMDALRITDPQHRDVIRRLHADSGKPSVWTTGYHRAYGEDLRLLVDLERHVDQVFEAEVEIIPGLFQHELYVRDICDRKIMRRGLTVDDVVEAWNARQEILYKADAPLYHVVMSESCLARRIGSAKVMKAQMDHLIEVSTLPNVVMQVLPFDAGPGYIQMPRPFTLLRVPSPGIAGPLRMAYIDGEGEIRYRDEPAAISGHEESWARLTPNALNPAETRRYIKHISSTFR